MIRTGPASARTHPLTHFYPLVHKALSTVLSNLCVQLHRAARPLLTFSSARSPHRRQRMRSPWVVLLPPPQGCLTAGDRTARPIVVAAQRVIGTAQLPAHWHPPPLHVIELRTSVKLRDDDPSFRPSNK
jgi:hypothetical protein